MGKKDKIDELPAVQKKPRKRSCGAGRPPAIGRKAYVEIDLRLLKETGEIRLVGDPIVAPVITTRVPRGEFEITYTAELFSIMQKMGNAKIRVFAWILDHKDGNNCINTNVRQLAKEVGVSHTTIASTLKILQEQELIERQGSVYMVSPRLMVKGSQVREAFLMKRFIEMDDKDDSLPTIEGQIEGQLEINGNGDIVERVK